MAQIINFGVDSWFLATNIETNKRPPKMTYLSTLGTCWSEYANWSSAILFTTPMWSHSTWLRLGSFSNFLLKKPKLTSSVNVKLKNFNISIFIVWTYKSTLQTFYTYFFNPYAESLFPKSYKKKKKSVSSVTTTREKMTLFLGCNGSLFGVVLILNDQKNCIILIFDLYWLQKT